MSYNRCIVSGNTVETFSYERSPNRFQGKRIGRASSRGADLSNLADDRGIAQTSDLAEEKRRMDVTKKKRENNCRRAKVAFRRLVLCNLSDIELPLLLTFTYAKNQKDLGIGYADFADFVRAMRRKFGVLFKYICVPEFQKRGAVHFHTLFWGLPASVFELERSTRVVASLWGHGFVYMKETDGNERLSGYLSKYMAKAFVDDRLFGHKAYTSSRNVNRPISVGAELPLSLMLEAMELSTGEARFSRSFDTQWLGRAIYKKYKL